MTYAKGCVNEIGTIFEESYHCIWKVLREKDWDSHSQDIAIR
jgi:hypothetical protein